eukprot:11177066-Ditylum_brightwellii.AAC.1
MELAFHKHMPLLSYYKQEYDKELTKLQTTTSTDYSLKRKLDKNQHDTITPTMATAQLTTQHNTATPIDTDTSTVTTASSLTMMETVIILSALTAACTQGSTKDSDDLSNYDMTSVPTQSAQPMTTSLPNSNTQLQMIYLAYPEHTDFINRLVACSQPPALIAQILQALTASAARNIDL